MPSQRHLIYLLPRADPEELQDGAPTLPCTCSYPLQLRVRIPPNPSTSTLANKSDTLSRYSDRGQSSPSSSHSRSPSSASSNTISPTRLSSSISSSRASKNQIATWKLLAPQIKTISSSSNTYLLSEAFPGIISASLQQSADVQRRERASSSSLASMVQDLKLDTIATSSFPAQTCSPTKANPPATHATPSPTSPASTSDTLPRAVDAPAPSTGLSTIQETTQSEEARQTPTRSAASPAAQLHPIITTPSTPIQRAFSSSTISSLPAMSHAGSLNGTRKVPTAYRKELESVLFAQTASSSSSSPSSASVRNSISAGGYSVVPTLTSSIFSLNSADELRYHHSSDTSSSSSSSRPSSITTSPASSMGNASISSIPFLDDAPTLICKPKLKHGSQDDHFNIGGHNSNVVHVNALGWYLEKVLWKLGLHRKGRKEFMTYWLARFANDDYVALRFLKQDEIEAFAPVEISVVSPSTTSPAISMCKESKSSASSSTLPVSSSSSPHPASSWPNERRRSSEQSAISNSMSSTTAVDMDDRNTCSSLSSRSMSNSTNTTSESSTPPSETEDNNSTFPLPILPENPYSFHKIHVVFQRLDKQDIALFQYKIKYRSGSSTLGVIDWNEIDGIVPSEESRREDRPRVLHVSATDLGRRGLYFN